MQINPKCSNCCVIMRVKVDDTKKKFTIVCPKCKTKTVVTDSDYGVKS